MSNSQQVSGLLKGNEITIGGAEDPLRAIDGGIDHCVVAEKLTTTSRGDDGTGATAGGHDTMSSWMAVGDNCEGVANDGFRPMRHDAEAEPLQTTISEVSEKDVLSEGDVIVGYNYTESEKSTDVSLSCHTGLCNETILSLKQIISKLKWCECEESDRCEFFKNVRSMFCSLLLMRDDVASLLETETSVSPNSISSKKNSVCSGSDKIIIDYDLSAHSDNEDNYVDNKNA